MDWSKYMENLEHIVDDLLLNKNILVICPYVSFDELVHKLREIYEDVGVLTLNFSQMNEMNLENEFYTEEFDKVYLLM